VQVLSREIGIDHALASQRLYTDGAEVLFDYATERSDDDLLELVVLRTGQTQFSELVRDYLQRITYGEDRADPLQGNAGAAKRGQHVGLSEAEERHRRLAAMAREDGDQRRTADRRTRPRVGLPSVPSDLRARGRRR
jgi:hypothetical protein